MEYIIAALVTAILVVGIINVIIMHENKMLEAENIELRQKLDVADDNDNRGPDGRYTGKGL